MSLAENIKRARLEKKLTQEQLAERLGVSPQAVSKWETSGAYPDGSLLVPLAAALDTSLDGLFGSSPPVSMAEISRQLFSLLHGTAEKDRFPCVRDICWQIECSLFNGFTEIEEGYDPGELGRQKNSSYILDDSGFTVVSNGREPFFAVFPQPEAGYGSFLENAAELRKVFEAMSHADTGKALVWLYRRTEYYLFESAVLAAECQIGREAVDGVMAELEFLRVVEKREICVNGERRVLYLSHPNHKLIALCLLAGEAVYSGAYSMQVHHRNTPLLRG